MGKKSFYEMMKIIEAGAATVAPTPLNSSSNPPPSAQANPTGAQLTQQKQQGTAQQKQNDVQQKQDDTNKLNFIKQLKDLLKKNLGINL